MSAGSIFVWEMLGTAVLILLGTGVVANQVLKNTLGNSTGFLFVNVGWAFAVFTGASIANPSGAHLNPAVTLGLAIADKTPWADVPVYIVATVPKIDQVDYAERSFAPGAQSTSDARHLALWTGGDLFWATNEIDALTAGRMILSELRHQYVIAVDSAADVNWRRLEVRVRDRRMVVRARSGYFGRDGGVTAIPQQ